jgi:hypothetical protein
MRRYARESLHHEILNLPDGHLGLLCYALEAQDTVIGRSTEDGLDQSHETDLLAKKGRVLLEYGLHDERVMLQFSF